MEGVHMIGRIIELVWHTSQQQLLSSLSMQDKADTDSAGEASYCHLNTPLHQAGVPDHHNNKS